MPASRRVLRIGVLVGNELLEERLLRAPEPVTIGAWKVLRVERGAYTLRLGPSMVGRVADGGKLTAFEPAAELREVPLTDQARGKVNLGDATLLFQFINEPPIQPRPTLPASVRGTLMGRIDPRLGVITAVSLVIHFALALAAWLHDRPHDRQTRGARAENMAPLEIAAPEWFEPDPVPAPTDNPGVSTNPTPSEITPSSPKSKPQPRVDRPVETDAAKLQEEAARYAAALASAGESKNGLKGEMGFMSPGGDLDDQIDETRKANAKVELGGNGERGPRDDGKPRDGTIKDKPIDGPDGPTHTAKVEKEPKGRIEIKSKKTFDESTLSPEAVTKRILDIYMTGLQRCQKDLLKDDPTASARVDLSFTVNESGRTTSPDAKSEYPSVDRCIEQRMSAWTFPAPKDSEGDETEASFAITLALQPE